MFAGYGLSLPSLIGLLMLMGIVTKNSILLVEYVVMARTVHGMNRMEALIDACAKRSRPIVMTTIAMIAGMFPVGGGVVGGSELPRADGTGGDRRADHVHGAEPVRRADGLHRAGRLPGVAAPEDEAAGACADERGSGAELKAVSSQAAEPVASEATTATMISRPRTMERLSKRVRMPANASNPTYLGASSSGQG